MARLAARQQRPPHQVHADEVAPTRRSGRQADADHRRRDRRHRPGAAALQPADGRDPPRAGRELVIFFRDQHITPEQHLDFGRKFGELHLHPAAPHEPGHPELMIIHADKESPRANGEGWHTDVSCDLEPPMGSILYIRKCPPRRRRHAVRQHVRRLRGAVGPDEGLSRRPDRRARRRAVYRGLYANYGVAGQGELSRAPSTRWCAPIR